jgi:gas vesicle protein
MQAAATALTPISGFMYSRAFPLIRRILELPMPKPAPANRITRRRFTLGAAVAAAVAVLPASESSGQASVPSQSAAEAMAKLSPEARAEVEMKISEIFRKYGGRLSDEQKADIRKVMAETQDGLEKMRSFALTNGDQPATVFKFDERERMESHA